MDDFAKLFFNWVSGWHEEGLRGLTDMPTSPTDAEGMYTQQAWIDTEPFEHDDKVATEEALEGQGYPCTVIVKRIDDPPSLDPWQASYPMNSKENIMSLEALVGDSLRLDRSHWALSQVGEALTDPIGHH